MLKYNNKELELNYLKDMYEDNVIEIQISLSLEYYTKEIINSDETFPIIFDEKKTYLDRNILLSILFDALNICPSFAFDDSVKKYNIEQLKEYSKYTGYKYIINENVDSNKQPSIDDLRQLYLLYKKNKEEFDFFVKSSLPDYVKYSALEFVLKNNLYFTKSLEEFLKNIYFNRSENSQFSLNYVNLTNIFFNYLNIKLFLNELIDNNNEYTTYLLNEYLYNAPLDIFLGLDNALSTFKNYNQKIVFINILHDNGILLSYEFKLDKKLGLKEKIEKELILNHMSKIFFVKYKNKLIDFNIKKVSTCDFYEFKNQIIQTLSKLSIGNYDYKLSLKYNYISISKELVNDIKKYIYYYATNKKEQYVMNPLLIYNKNIISCKNTDLMQKIKEKYKINDLILKSIQSINIYKINDLELINRFNNSNFKIIEKYNNPLLIRLSYEIDFSELSEYLLDILNLYITDSNINFILDNKSNLFDIENLCHLKNNLKTI